jgi:hypothetical protein
VGIKVSLNDYNPFLPIYFSPLQLVCSIWLILEANNHWNKISINPHWYGWFLLTVSEPASKNDILMCSNSILQYPDLLRLVRWVVFWVFWASGPKCK